MTETHTNPQPIKLYWSCTPAPVGMVLAWSARALYLPSKCNVWKDDKRIPPKAGMDEALEFLPDRQAFVGADGKEEMVETPPHSMFADCIDEVIIPSLLDELSRTTPSGDSYDKIEIAGDDASYPWHLVATPNGSYGYMYVSVWLMPEEEIEEEEDDSEAMQQGMGLGIDAYNEARGMDTSNPEDNDG